MNEGALRAAHTAEHLLSAVMQRLFDTGRSVETHLGKKKSKCDYRVGRPLGDADLRRIEEAVNAAIAQDLPVRTFVIERGEAERRYDTSKLPPDADPVRIVAIGDLDLMPCVGPHVERTGTLGRFAIRSAQRKASDLVRIRYVLSDDPTQWAG